ncbi:DUF6773 family protein [Anaerotignum sp.]|nr:DUF6773 family protein [Anaerotignum sp.]MBQ7757965.1 hypothetical protein [Anaerotignum sp.]
MTNFVDERVLQARRKIGSEMMMLMYYFIVISFLVKVMGFGMGLEDCITEFIIMIGAPIYQNIRARQMKVILGDFRKKSKASTISAIFAAVVVMLISMWRLEGSIDKAEALSSIVSFAVTFALARYGFAHIEKKRARKLEAEYEED